MNDVRQIPLPLLHRKALGRADFFVSACNCEAVSWIDAPEKWPLHALLVCGAKGSGKTHLAAIFGEQRFSAMDISQADINPAGRVVIEDIESLTDEKSLFHLFNAVKERGGKLLMTMASMPDVKLADLRSRLGATPKVYIAAPDEELLYAVLSKAFFERHIAVDSNVLEYIVYHAPRTFEAIHSIIDKADKAALAAGRRITVPLIKEIL